LTERYQQDINDNSRIEDQIQGNLKIDKLMRESEWKGNWKEGMKDILAIMQ